MSAFGRTLRRARGARCLMRRACRVQEGFLPGSLHGVRALASVVLGKYALRTGCLSRWALHAALGRRDVQCGNRMHEPILLADLRLQSRRPELQHWAMRERALLRRRSD